ncbi:MAG: dTDP-4-dehydrorhamnose reductase [Gemmatimonadota bacterium]
MRILVTGARGLLGADVLALAEARGHDALGLAREHLDVTDALAVEAVIRGHEPDAVVQCAAYTAVDRAEEEPALAMRVNRDGAAHVAAACRSVGAVLAYVSTDYVFGGRHAVPWGPGEHPEPANHYGRTKLAGERAVAASGADFVIARVSWLFGAARRSFVDAMVARAEAGHPLRLVDDQFSTPTWTRTAAATLVSFLEGGARGIYHVTSGGGAATRLDFAGEAVRIRGLDVPLEGVPTGTFPEPARRPPYTVLDVGTTEAFLGRPLPGWREDLRRYLEEV